MPETWNTIYCGPAPVPAELWLRWNLDPVLLLALGALGFWLRRSRSGLLAVAALVLAFVSPLCALSAALFSARVVHHVLLIGVAAPLLARAWPAGVPRAGSVALLASTLILWAWHLPAAYDLALSWVPAYWAMQLSLLWAFTAFWRAVLPPGRPVGPALALIFVSWMQMALLGALLTLAPGPLYEAHALAPFEWDLTPLRDQQLGGLLMWIPAGIPFLAWAALIMRRGWRGLTEGTV
ncbi:cytochrome c oxidase assembly protein [Jannaschia formosa]|nr:cytochrome c oxidase assembly protein [Jannaschia formosa]